MAGIDTTVTQLYDKVIIAGLDLDDYGTSTTTTAAYGYLNTVETNSNLEWGDELTITPTASGEESSTQSLVYEVIEYPQNDTHIVTNTSGTARHEVNVHVLICLEPFSEDGKTKYHLVLRKGSLSEAEYPFLGGFVVTDEESEEKGQVKYVGFFDSVDTIALLQASYPDTEFALIHTSGKVGIDANKTYQQNTDYDTRAAKFPIVAQNSYEIWAGFVTDLTEWFGVGGANLQNPNPVANHEAGHTYHRGAAVIYDGKLYEYTYETASVSSPGDSDRWVVAEPNKYLYYSKWEVVLGGGVKPNELVPEYSDLDDSTYLLSNTPSAESGGLLLTGNTTLHLDGFHQVTPSISSEAVLDKKYVPTSDPYYMACILKKKVRTAGILSEPFTYTFDWTISPDSSEYNAETQYSRGNLCHVNENGTDRLYLYIYPYPSTGVPLDNTDYWEADPDVNRDETETWTITSLVDITTVNGGSVSYSLVNTRALRQVLYTSGSTGITLQNAPQTIPDESGLISLTFKRTEGEVATNYGTDDPKNGGTMAGYGYNLYRGIDNGSSPPNLENYELIKSRVFFVGSRDASTPDTAVISDTADIEPYENYLYVLTFYFTSYNGAAIYSPEYVCYQTQVTSSITRFKNGVDPVFFGVGSEQLKQATIQYLEDSDDCVIEHTVEATDHERYLYLVLGEVETPPDVVDPSETKSRFEAGSVAISDASITSDIDATILGYAKVASEYSAYAPTFTGIAKISLDADEEIFPADDLFTANRLPVIAKIQNGVGYINLPSLTWAPAHENYTVYLFLLVTQNEIDEKLPDLLWNGKENSLFNFDQYQVIAKAHLSERLKALPATFTAEFRLSFA